MKSALGHVNHGIDRFWDVVGLWGCLIIRRVEPRPKENPAQDPGHFAATGMPCLPFQLDNEDQSWLEILIKVDKGQLLAWMGSGQEY